VRAWYNKVYKSRQLLLYGDELVSEKPFDLIHNSLEKEVKVYLRDGRLFVGIMSGYDKDLNIALSDVSVTEDGKTKEYDQIVIRRNNILSIGNDEGILWEE